MSTALLISLLALCPPLFIVLHTLIGAFLIPIYGVEKIRWRAGAIEIVAKTKEVEIRGRKQEVTRIWFRPGAQTWGLIIFFADERNLKHEPLQVHERVHIIQTYLFGVLYLLTYGIAFGILFAIVKLKLDWWERKKYPNGEEDDDVWHAYRKIPWEIWAYAKEDKFERGELVGAWGSFD